MKKLILTAVILSTLTMCKKADLQEANNTIKNADSLMDKASESLENLDSDAKATLDSVNLKAKDLLKNKEEIEKAFENSKNKIDSISENVEKFKKDIEEKKISSNIDSIKNQIKKNHNQSNQRKLTPMHLIGISLLSHLQELPYSS